MAEDSKTNQHLPGTKGLIHRGPNSTHKTCIGPNQTSPSRKKGSGHKVLPLTKKLCVINTCSQRETQSLGISTTLQGRSHAMECLINTKWIPCFYVLFLLWLIGFCFVFCFIFLVFCFEKENMKSGGDLKKLREGEEYNQNIL